MNGVKESFNAITAMSNNMIISDSGGSSLKNNCVESYKHTGTHTISDRNVK